MKTLHLLKTGLFTMALITCTAVFSQGQMAKEDTKMVVDTAIYPSKRKSHFLKSRIVAFKRCK